MKDKKRSFFIPNIIYVLVIGFLFRVFIANFGTLELDHGTFVAWGNSLATYGLKNFYNGWSDYLPGYLYILWLLGKINMIFPYLQTILFKLPAIFADLATGYLIYKIVGKKKGILFSIFYIFNPAIFANSSLWGQADSLTAMFSVLSLYIFPYSYLLSAVFLSLGTLIKPQAAFILPAILYLFVKSDINKLFIQRIFKLIKYSLVGLIFFVAGFIPFNNSSTLYNFILERLTVSSGQYPYGSINAFSFWGLFGFWKPDNISFWIGLLVSVLFTAVVSVSVYKKKIDNGQYQIAALSLLIFFMFLTRIHERHLLPVLAPLLISSFGNPVLLIAYLGLSSTYILNLSYSYFWITDNFKEIFNPTLIKFFIITNLSLLILTVVTIFKKFKSKFDLVGLFKFKSNKTNTIKINSIVKFPTKDITKKYANILLFAVLLFSLFTRIYNLGTPKEMYFDEIYHSFTARLVLNNDPKAWEWWNPHPEGFAYEWTHPPLSKLGMALAMYIAGDNSFGWRIPQAILGTLSVLMIYLLANEIFKDRKTSILSAFVFSLDGLPLVLSRMGMNDSYVLFFALLSVYLFIKDKNFLSSLVYGLALSSKWSALYVFPILFISHFVFRKKITISYLSFIVFPIAVYIASYGIMFATGHTWAQFIEVQKQMWWYHTSLVAEHPYTSPAWSWPLLLRPIYLYDGQEINGMVARIYAFGNPLVFWFGFFSIILSGFISYKERFRKLGFVVFSYLILFLPWIASPRIMFLYHYLPSIPYMAIAAGFILRRFPKIIPYLLIPSVLLFVYFYPHWTGMRIPLKLDESYYWFASWR